MFSLAPGCIFVGGLPYRFAEAHVRELLECVAPLREFNLVKDRETRNSKGYAFCVYQDLSVTYVACAIFNGLELCNRTLIVRHAYPAQQEIDLQRLAIQPTLLATKVLCVTQLVTEDELRDDKDDIDILDDKETEFGEFDDLVSVVISRRNPNGDPSPEVGKVFLEYVDAESASKAGVGLSRRKINGNQVGVVFYPENKLFSIQRTNSSNKNTMARFSFEVLILSLYTR